MPYHDKKMKVALIKFNNRLHTFQKRVIKEAKILDAQLIKRVRDPDDMLEDYEIEMQISYYLKEDDEEFVEDDDNILTTHTEYVKKISLEDESESWEWGDVNHNMFQNWEHELNDEHHCWLYYRLYDGLANGEDVKQLSWNDILRVGDLWMDLNVTYQYVEIL